jgi:hypothetical protein
LLHAIVAIVGIERFADEAAIAGLGGFPAAEQSDLSLKLNGGGGDQRYSQLCRRVADEQPGREIVAAVEDKIVAREQPLSVAFVQPLRDPMNGDVGVQRAGKSCRELRLRNVDLIVAKHRLALQVRPLNRAVVDDRQATDAGARKRRDHGTSNPACADHRDA